MGPIFLPAVQERLEAGEDQGGGPEASALTSVDRAGAAGSYPWSMSPPLGAALPRMPLLTPSLFKLLEVPSPDFSLGRESPSFFKPLLPRVSVALMDKKSLILSTLYSSCYFLLDSEHVPVGL